MPDMDSVKFPLSLGIIPLAPGRSTEEIEDYWSSVVTGNGPISDDLKDLVRAEFKRRWHTCRIKTFRQRIGWNWGQLDWQKVILDGYRGEVTPEKPHLFRNKMTAFYWLQKAQDVSANGDRLVMRGITKAAIFREWWNHSHGTPYYEFGHYLANLVRIKSQGPSTLPGVIRAHREMCMQACHLLTEATEGQQKVSFSGLKGVKNYQIHPLYKAIIMVMDRYDEIDRYPECQEGPNGFISAQKVAQHQSVLLVRAGIEDGLSAPISFANLRDECLPLQRIDVSCSMIPEVIRTSITTASWFIWDLEWRERLNLPQSDKEPAMDRSLHPMAPSKAEVNLERIICDSPEEYAERNIRAAEISGYGSCPRTSSSIRQVQAAAV